MKLVTTFLPLLFICWGISCSAPEDTAEDTDNPANVPGSETPKDPLAGKEVLDNPDTANPETATSTTVEIDLEPGSELLGAASAALVSAGGVLESSEGASLNLAESSGQSTNDPLCNENAGPWDVDDEANMADSDASYAQRLFYCAIFSNTIESSEAVAGILKQNQSITCTVENHFSLTADSYTSTETELVTGSEAVTAALTEECWPQGQPDGVTAVPFTSVKIQALDLATTGFSHKIAIKSAPMNVDMELRTFSKDGIIGFSRQDLEKVSPGVGDDMRLTLDTNKGVLMFNSIGDRNGGGGADSAYRTLIRAYVKGTLDPTTLAFTSVDNVEGFYGISGPGFAAANDTNYTYSFYTGYGNSTTGFQWKRFSHDGSGATPTLDSTSCTDGDETCSDAEDLGSLTEIHALMTRSAETEDAWKGLIDGGMPLCEPAIGTGVDLSPVPTFLAAGGNCDSASVASATPTPMQFTCNQNFTSDSFNKNCSTLFSAESADAAATSCALDEDSGGQGCCESSSVFTNAFGAVTSYEVVPIGLSKGEGTTYQCD